MIVTKRNFVNSTTDIRLLQMLVNEDFINYVLNPNLTLKEKWEDYFKSHTEIIPYIDEATRILLGESVQENLSSNDALELEKSIFDKCGLAFK